MQEYESKRDQGQRERCYTISGGKKGIRGINLKGLEVWLKWRAI